MQRYFGDHIVHSDPGCGRCAVGWLLHRRPPCGRNSGQDNPISRAVRGERGHLGKLAFRPQNAYTGPAGRVLEGDVCQQGTEEAGGQDEKDCHTICKESTNWAPLVTNAEADDPRITLFANTRGHSSAKLLGRLDAGDQQLKEAKLYDLPTAGFIKMAQQHTDRYIIDTAKVSWHDDVLYAVV